MVESPILSAKVPRNLLSNEIVQAEAEGSSAADLFPLILVGGRQTDKSPPRIKEASVRPLNQRG
jgi:hypothetical protein